MDAEVNHSFIRTCAEAREKRWVYLPADVFQGTVAVKKAAIKGDSPSSKVLLCLNHILLCVIDLQKGEELEEERLTETMF